MKSDFNSIYCKHGLLRRSCVRCQNEEDLIILEAENERLRDALRWRKYPEEKPENGTHIIVRQHGLIFVALPEGERGKKARSDGSFVWLPIPPLEDK